MTSAAPDIPRLRFSTGDFPERDRAEAWREILGRAVMKLEIDPLPGCSYEAGMSIYALPGLIIGAGVYSGMQFRRTPALIDSDDLVLVVTLAGGRTMRQHGREVTLGGGEAALVSCEEPGLAVSHSRERFLTFRLPRNVVAPMIADLDGTLIRRVPQNSDALRLLVGYAEFVRNAEVLGTPELRQLAARHMHDLIALTLGASRDAAVSAESRGVRGARLHAIKADVAAHFSDRALTVGAVAARHGVSARYIQMLFEGEGTTFSQFVLRQRLACAHRMLTNPRYSGQTITAIAYDAGFGDLSAFNHAFRRIYGVPPSDVRASAQRAGGSQ